MTLKKLFGLGLCAVTAVAVVACSSPATPTPTSAPAKPAATTAAPAATTAPAAQPAATKPAEPTKPAAAAPAKTAFPEKGKSIIFTVPYPAGGATDMGARLLCAAMERELGVPVQVVNKGGAGSQTGLTDLSKQKPDGYSIGLANIPTANLVYLDPERKAAFDGKSFVQIGVHVVDASAIGVSATGPYKSIKDLVDAAKAKPEQVKFGSDGPMTDDHLGIYMLEKQTGAKFANVAFDSGGQAMTSLLGGHIDASFGHVGDFLTQVKGGQARVIGVASDTKSKFYPDVPTMKEQGFDLINSSSRIVVAPAGTPKEVLDVLGAAMKKAVEDPDQKKKLEEAGLDLQYSDGAKAAAFWAETEAKAKILVDAVRADQK